MRYTICTNFPRADEHGSGARPHVDDMVNTIKLRLELEVDQGPYPSLDGTAKFCYMTDDAAKAMALISMLNEKGIDSYWYDDNPKRRKGDVIHFGSKNRWDKVEKVA